MRTVTVVVKDDRRSWPLIYTIEISPLPGDAARGIDAAWDHSDEIMEKICTIRDEELEEEPGDSEEHIELLFAFEGDAELALDWRD